MNCCYGGPHTYGVYCLYKNEQPLKAWEKELLYGRPEGEGDLPDIAFTKVRVDSIGPGAANYGVICFEYFGNDDVVHVPFVKYWTISY